MPDRRACVPPAARLWTATELPGAGAAQPGAKDLCYDFTLQAALVSRGNQDLALVPVSSARDAGLVLKPRTGGDTQRRHADTSNALRMQTVHRGAEAAPGPGSVRRRAAATDRDRPRPHSSRLSSAQMVLPSVVWRLPQRWVS
ncbi:hypothetical protein [Streptomyces sp. NPDC047079]|uniref:hypothetical protein n=1 Tax=Streptomyces sp. NPDC047079 TaxID=3154607 RepID=UPI0033EA36AA